MIMICGKNEELGEACRDQNQQTRIYGGQKVWSAQNCIILMHNSKATLATICYSARTSSRFALTGLGKELLVGVRDLKFSYH